MNAMSISASVRICMSVLTISARSTADQKISRGRCVFFFFCLICITFANAELGYSNHSSLHHHTVCVRVSDVFIIHTLSYGATQIQAPKLPFVASPAASFTVFMHHIVFIRLQHSFTHYPYWFQTMCVHECPSQALINSQFKMPAHICQPVHTAQRAQPSCTMLILSHVVLRVKLLQLSFDVFPFYSTQCKVFHTLLMLKSQVSNCPGKCFTVILFSSELTWYCSDWKELQLTLR